MSTPDTPPEGGGTDTFVMVGGEDWDQVVTAAAQADAGERIVVNMGPQHPSTHGVLRLILEIEGETIVSARCGIGYLHTGIEKNLEYRNLDPGRHVRHPNGLPLTAFQRDGVLPRRREAARRHR